MASLTIRLARKFRAAACLAAFGTGGCGGATPAPAPDPAARDECILPTGEPGDPREILVATARSEEPTVAARRGFEPLIRLDCVGAARPGLAQSWTTDSSHRAWTFVFAPSAAGVTPASAAAEWRTRPDAATTLRYSGVASLEPLDERRLVVSLDRPADSVPFLFADVSLGLVTDTLPPAGTTFVPFRLAGEDPRDALDAGADILRTSDPAVLEYARSRNDFTVHPLPWSRTYVLVVPPGGDGLTDLIPGDSAAFRAGLARDAVHAEARAAEPPFWWSDVGPCPAIETREPTPDQPGANRIGYAREDPVARALAERVVALSDRSMTPAGGLPARLLAASLRDGVGRAYVVPVPRTALVPCRELARWPVGSVLVPLIDTRMSAIVRRGVPALAVEFDGGLRPVDSP
ncbi:MAG: hypothetical protein H0T50_00850 [Gemmatimonadales bacterium]|nr:hypothetical protein [Gemmatimonadales bacterium]